MSIPTGSATSQGRCAFTISARNFIPRAITLYESLKAHHPDIKFYMALCDSDAGIDRDALPFEVITLRELDQRVWEMSKRYNITEFCTAIKPLVFELLMRRHPDAPVCYFDPDILILDELTELWDAFENGAQVVLTPHLLQPSPRPDLFADETMLLHGSYNLGFLGVRNAPATREVMSWLADTLETKCVIDTPRGLFVDQKWADLLPSMLDGVVILRHPGYNIAYWNFLERRVALEEGRWIVNGVPARFVHFSGYDVADPAVLSRHAQFLDKWLVGDLEKLFALYRDKVLAADFERYANLPYAFNWLGPNGVNLHAPSAANGFAKSNGGVVRWIGGADQLLLTNELWSVELSGSSDYEKLKPDLDRSFSQHRRTENAIGDLEGRSFKGRCHFCSADVEFRADSSNGSGRGSPGGRHSENWHERLRCPSCGLGPQTRALVHYIEFAIRPRRDAIISLDTGDPSLVARFGKRWSRSRNYASSIAGGEHALDLMLSMKVRHLPRSSARHWLNISARSGRAEDSCSQCLRKTARALRQSPNRIARNIGRSMRSNACGPPALETRGAFSIGPKSTAISARRRASSSRSVPRTKRTCE